MLIRRKYRQKD